MQSLIQQNGRLRQIMQKCEQQIIQLRKIGQQHQQQIDNLLKFNQRLLSIIQNQMPNKTISRTSSGGNLQPIDQAANQKQHQLIGVNSNNININNNNHINHINHNNRYTDNNHNQPIQQHYINHNNNVMRERVEHLQREQVQHLKQQDKNYTHNHNENNNRNSNYNNSNINKTHNNQSPTMKINITKSTHNHNNRYYQNNNRDDQNNNPHDQNNNRDDQNEQNHQLKFINTQSYSPRTDQNQNQQYQYYQQQHHNHKTNNHHLSNQHNNRQQQFDDNDNDSQQKQEGVIIYREQKQSLIDIPKLFKLQKGLNQHYHKQLFHSIEQHKHLHNNNKNYLNTNNNNNNNSNDRKLSIPSQTSQFMGKISQAQTQRLQQVNQQQLYTQFMSIRQLINQYKQDFNLQQYLHLCQIIKDDLHNDIKQIKQSSNQRSTLLQNKHRQCQILKQDIMQFNPIDNIKSIMNRLNISKQTQSIVIRRVNNNGKQYQNDNTVSNVSIMARKR